MYLFHKTINRDLWLIIICLLSGCTQVPISTISDKHAIQQVSFTHCNLLGHVSCMGGAKNAFVFQGPIPNTLSEGHVAIIGLADGAILSHTILKRAMECKNEVKKLIWQADGNFISWYKVDGSGKFILEVEQDDYQKLTLHNYNIHMLYTPYHETCLPLYSYSPTPIQMLPLPNYRNIQLQAIAYSTRQTDSGMGWLLKGSIASDASVANAKIGFILVKEDVNPYDLVQKMIGTGEVWPTTPMSFNNDHIIVVPGVLRKSDAIVEGALPSKQAPIKGSRFKLLCYVIHHNHYYLSQMGHILPKSTNGSYTTECEPPSITFTGNNYNLQTLNLAVYREQILNHDAIRNVKFSDFKIQYSINNQEEKFPSNLKACLLFLPKGIIWRTAKVESLFKQLHANDTSSCMTDDATLCLIRDKSQILDLSCIDFFRDKTDYEFLTCLFSTADQKLKYYTEKKEIKVENKQIEDITDSNIASPLNTPDVNPSSHKAQPTPPETLLNTTPTPKDKRKDSWWKRLWN